MFAYIESIVSINKPYMYLQNIILLKVNIGGSTFCNGISGDLSATAN